MKRDAASPNLWVAFSFLSFTFDTLFFLIQLDSTHAAQEQQKAADY